MQQPIKLTPHELDILTGEWIRMERRKLESFRLVQREVNMLNSAVIDTICRMSPEQLRQGFRNPDRLFRPYLALDERCELAYMLDGNPSPYYPFAYRSNRTGKRVVPLL